MKNLCFFMLTFTLLLGYWEGSFLTGVNELKASPLANTGDLDSSYGNLLAFVDASEKIPTHSRALPNIKVWGGEMEILNGNKDPKTIDGTDFGSSFPKRKRVHKFLIDNSIGTGDLNIDDIRLEGIGAEEFGVNAEQMFVPAGASKILEITYKPTSLGVHPATLLLCNDDCDKSLYTFDIQGNAECEDYNLYLIPFDVSCPSARDGHIETYIESISSDAYAYKWSNGLTTSYLSDLLPGLYRLTVEDNYGCSSVKSVRVNGGIDFTPPQVKTKSATIQLNAYGSASIKPEDIDDGSSDECGIAFKRVVPANFSCQNAGVNIVKLIVTDVSGNTSTGEAVVVVEDANPIAKSRDFNLSLNHLGNAVLSPFTLNAGSYDICGIKKLSLSQTNFTKEDVGENMIILTVTDSYGNTSTSSSKVTIFDPFPTIEQHKEEEGVVVIKKQKKNKADLKKGLDAKGMMAWVEL